MPGCRGTVPLTATTLRPTASDSPHAGLSYEWNMDDRSIILTGRVIKYQFPRGVTTT